MPCLSKLVPFAKILRAKILRVANNLDQAVKIPRLLQNLANDPVANALGPAIGPDVVRIPGQAVKNPRVLLDLGPAIGPDVVGRGRAIDLRNVLREIAIASLETTSPSYKLTKRVLENGSNAFIWAHFVKYSARAILSALT